MCWGQIIIMARTCISFAFFVIIFQRIDSEICILRTESGEYTRVCCADYEAKHNDCIACPKGYTSYAGQNCRPCPENTYGERCRYDCSCTGFEFCNITEGCVQVKTTTEMSGMSGAKTSEYSTYKVAIDTTSYKYDPATTKRIQDESTTSKILDNNKTGQLSTEMILIIALAVVVVLFGICLCFLFYKYAFAAERRRPTLLESENTQDHQRNDTIEIEDRLYHFYNIINDADMVDDHHLQQIQISSDYVDVIRSSDSIASSKSKSEVSYDIPCEDLSSAGTTKYKSNGAFCISGASTSLHNNEHQESAQDYVNLYQPLIKLSPPIKEEYLTLATVDRTDGNSLDYNTNLISTKTCVLQHSQQLEILRQLHEYENFPIKFECRNIQRCISNLKGQVSKSCGDLNVKCLQRKISSEKDDKHTNSTRKYMCAKYNTFKWKSESDIFCMHGPNLK